VGPVAEGGIVLLVLLAKAKGRMTIARGAVEQVAERLVGRRRRKVEARLGARWTTAIMSRRRPAHHSQALRIRLGEKGKSEPPSKQALLGMAVRQIEEDMMLDLLVRPTVG
jgi:hypothetical protein